MILIIRRTSVAMIASICIAAVVLLTARVLSQSVEQYFFTSAKLRPIYRVNTSQNCLALTFDIGWGEVSPGRVLDVLKEKGVACTFFLSGPWAAAHPATVQRIAAEGHEVATHAYWHDNLSQVSKERMVESLRRTREIIEGLVGREAKYLRPPNGDFNETVVQTALEEGYLTIIWSLDSLDWLNPGVDYMVNRVLTRAQPGDIVLLHASDSARETYLALPTIIDGLRAKGFRLVTLTELFGMAGEQYMRQPDRSLVR